MKRFLLILALVMNCQGIQPPGTAERWTDTQKPDTKVLPDVGLSTPEMVSRQGYPVESHYVMTEDGYLLTMFRLPRPRRPAVFLQHCLLCSSDVWVEMGPNRGLAYLLYNENYDVWLGNSRGNIYSRGHNILTTYSTNGIYWDFSWHEMGVFDLPAELDYVLDKTGHSQLNYVGHSMGTTMFWALASQRPTYNAKIRQMHAFGPGAFYTHGFQEPFLVEQKDQMSFDKAPPRARINYELLPSSELFKQLQERNCHDRAKMQETCAKLYFLIFGIDSDQLNKTVLPVILSHFLAGTSIKTFIHYVQQFGTGKFSLFDQGSRLKNLIKYRSVTPPEYDLSKVTAPVYLHYSGADKFSHIDDVMKLKSRLPNCRASFHVEHKSFNHMDFLWGVDVKQLVYDKVIDLLEDV